MSVARIACPLLLVIVLLAGCTSTRHPAVRVAGARLDAATDDAVKLQIALELVNPNDEPLQLLEFDYRVDVEGRTVYRGKRSAEMTLARRAARGIDLPAVIGREELAAAGGALAEVNYQVHGTLRYLAPGAIAQTLFDTGFRRPSAPLRGGGVVTLAQGAESPRP